MNKLVSFGLCTLSNDELLQKIDSLTDQMYQTGRIPDRQIPARPNDDYDLLIGELLVRFKNRNVPDVASKEVREEEIEGCNVCGSKKTLIRGKFPNLPKRMVCPCCIQERLEQINEISSPYYGQTFQSNPQKGEVK